MSTRSCYRRLTAAAALAVLSLLAAGCTSDNDAKAGPMTSTSAPSTSAASASPSPTSLSPEDQAVADATTTVTAYYQMVDRVATETTSDINALQDVSSNAALGIQTKIAVQARTQGRTQIGSSTILSVTPFSIDLSKGPATQPPKYPTVVLDVCVDYSKVNVVDAEGKSVVLATRLSKSTARLSVMRFGFGWRVDEIQSAGQPCVEP